MSDRRDSQMLAMAAHTLDCTIAPARRAAILAAAAAFRAAVAQRVDALAAYEAASLAHVVAERALEAAVAGA